MGHSFPHPSPEPRYAMRTSSLTKSPRLSNAAYWKKLAILRKKYSLYTYRLIISIEQTLKTPAGKELGRRVQAVHSLLKATPSHHNFECRIEILHAAEKQIRAWMSQFPV